MLITYPIDYSQKILNRIDANISWKLSCTCDLEYDGLRKKTFVHQSTLLQFKLGRRKFAYYLSFTLVLNSMNSRMKPVKTFKILATFFFKVCDYKALTYLSF